MVGNAGASEITLLDRLFKDLRDTGQFQDTNPFYVECVRFCFIDLIKQNMIETTKTDAYDHGMPQAYTKDQPMTPEGKIHRTLTAI